MEEARYAIVEISREGATKILDWMRKFEKGGVLDGPAFVQFWDYSATFLKDLDKSFPDHRDGDVFVANFSELLAHPSDLDVPAVRTELDMMSICSDSVVWKSCIKHTDAGIESPRLTRESIEEMIADFAKEAT
jgi:hypothetical protein